jgi:hypothetical protein
LGVVSRLVCDFRYASSERLAHARWTVYNGRMRLSILVASPFAVGLLVAACGDSSKTTEVGKSTFDLDPGAFVSPLDDSVPVASVFDHDLPFEFADTNGYLLSFWGE